MKFDKLPITIEQQIEKLKERGLIFEDDIKAAHYLSNISYYRLRAYTYPFQNKEDINHSFNRAITFNQIIQLYVFYRQLRLLIFNAIEKIEVALRTQIIYQYALVYGSHWHLKPELYNNSLYFAEQIATLQKEIDRSNETFIKHYKEKYTDPKSPPSWMSLEVSSIGLLSKLFSNLKNDFCKDKIANHFGLKNVDVLKNWMYCFSVLRNTCAHHGRIWNRRFYKIVLPKKSINHFISNADIYNNKIYASCCCILYILNIINPNHDFKNKLVDLMENCPLL